MFPRELPFVIHCFEPVIVQPSPFGVAAVRSEPASDPDPGSVSANAPRTRPAASSGTKRSRWAGVPNAMIGSVTALVCTATVTPTPASARDSSSSTRMYERKSAPAPPSSSGTQTPIKPSSPSFEKTARGNVWSRSQVAACGAISRAGECASELLDLALLGGRESTGASILHRRASIVPP